MKSDYYLNRCLEQASLSPLRYRHGCIVVKGGKIIGQGFNDYRPGYDGGALKTGRLSTGSYPLDGVYSELKHARKGKPSNNASTPPKAAGAGGGRLVNTPLTMHSEMMAINSALSSSSTLAADDYYETTPSNLTSSAPASKPWRREFNNVPVPRRVKSGVLKPVHLNAVLPLKKPHGRPHHHHHQNREGKGTSNDRDRRCKKHLLKKEQLACGRQLYETHDHPEGLVARHPLGTSPGIKMKQDTMSSRAGTKLRARHSGAPPNTLMLVPSYPTPRPSSDARERKRHPRLSGADVYVTRLNNPGILPKQPGDRGRPAALPGRSSDGTCTDPMHVRSCDPSTGSLHDELTCARPRNSAPATKADFDTSTLPKALESSPCYRCVAYMHSVGVKRVFWTNNEGKWQGAKVRDLVDMMDGGTKPCGSDGVHASGIVDRMFVTKHEVLMLRRVMGA